MKIVVIGNKGRWAQNHIKTLKNLGVYGGGIDIESSWKVFFNKERPDGAVVVTNAVNHFEIVNYCLLSKIPVYCEKPIATEEWQLQIYEDIINSSKEFNVNRIFQAGFQLLYDPTIDSLLGDQLFTFISRRLGGNYRNESSVNTLMIHDIAVAHYLFGSYYEVREC